MFLVTVLYKNLNIISAANVTWGLSLAMQVI